MGGEATPGGKGVFLTLRDTLGGSSGVPESSSMATLPAEKYHLKLYS